MHRGRVKRYHHHPDALLGIERFRRHTVAERAVFAVAGGVFFLMLPWALLLLTYLLLGPERTLRWLHQAGAGWLIPGFL